MIKEYASDLGIIKENGKLSKYAKCSDLFALYSVLGVLNDSSYLLFPFPATARWSLRDNDHREILQSGHEAEDLAGGASGLRKIQVFGQEFPRRD